MFRSLFLAILMLTSTYAYSGRCDYPSDIARDGSRCGDRAASIRPGGRNPDTDWIMWVLLGGVIFFIYSSSKKKNSSNHYTPPKNSKRPVDPPTSPPQNFSPNNKSSITSPEHPKSQKIGNATDSTHYSVDNIAVRKILKDFYSLDVEAEFELPFFQICLQAKELGGNNHDAAARYILSQLGSLQDIPGDNITKFYDVQTRNLVKTKDLQSMETPGYFQALNLMRAMRGLGDLEVS